MFLLGRIPLRSWPDADARSKHWKSATSWIHDVVCCTFIYGCKLRIVSVQNSDESGLRLGFMLRLGLVVGCCGADMPIAAGRPMDQLVKSMADAATLSALCWLAEKTCRRRAAAETRSRRAFPERRTPVQRSPVVASSSSSSSWRLRRLSLRPRQDDRFSPDTSTHSTPYRQRLSFETNHTLTTHVYFCLML